MLKLPGASCINVTYAQNGHRNVSTLFLYKLGVWMLLAVRTHSFSWSEKSNEVNKDFKLCFHFNIHIYIKYSTFINGDKHCIHKVSTQKLNQNYMNLDTLKRMRFITFPVAWNVSMTARSAIIIHIFKLNCGPHVMRMYLSIVWFE